MTAAQQQLTNNSDLIKVTSRKAKPQKAKLIKATRIQVRN